MIWKTSDNLYVFFLLSGSSAYFQEYCCEFELYLRQYLHFQTYSIRKAKNSLLSQVIAKIVPQQGAEKIRKIPDYNNKKKLLIYKIRLILILKNKQNNTMDTNL